MTAVRLWVRHDLRRRWLQLIVLAVLVAIVVGTGAAALAGAKRGGTAVDRLFEATTGFNSLIAANPGIQYPWAEFDELPYVDGRWGLTAIAGFHAKGFEHNDWLTVPSGDDFAKSIEVPVMLEGRMFDPDTPNELVISQELAEVHNKEVGDLIEVQLPTPDEAADAMESFDEVTEPHGPKVTWKVVGIAVTGWMVPEAISPDGKAFLSPATIDKYNENLVAGIPVDQLTVISIFRLHNPKTDIAKLTADAKRLSGSPEVDVWNVHERFIKPARDSTRFEAMVLAAFGALALLAGAFLVGSAIARSAATEAIELRKGLAIGMTPRQASFAAAGTTVLASAIGAVVGSGAAFAASSWFPIGQARLMEPNPGLAFDWVVLPLLAIAAALLAGLLAVAAARRQVATHPSDVKGRASMLATRLSDASAPVPVVMGTRLALESSPGRNAVPVRPAQFGAILAVLGVISVLVFSAGIKDALAHPERFGQVHDVTAFLGFGNETFMPVEEVTPALTGLDYVDGIWDMRMGNATADDGSLSTIVYSGQTDAGLTPTLFEGRLPESQNEVFLAVRTARALDLSIGDTVEFDGAADTRELTVTGLGFLPKGPHNGYADGGYVTDSGYDRLFGEAFHFRVLGVASDKYDSEGLAKKLRSDLPGLGEQFETHGPMDETLQLESVRKFPIALAAFLAILGVGVVGNALVLAVRRRVGELAVLRAVGMTGRQSAATVLTQSVVLLLVGLAFGIPLGLAGGRIAWQAVSSFVPIQYVAPDWGMPLLFVSTTALAIVLVLALWPARRAARFHIASVLRAE